MSTQPIVSPLQALSPDQVNRADSAQWTTVVRQALVEARTACPGFLVEDMNATSQTVTVQIGIQEQVRTATGSAWADIPPVVFVPIMVPRGGGFSVTLPLKKGDNGMLIFCDRCIDFWWANGQGNSPAPTTPKGAPISGSQRQNEIRQHYVHDCGFYPGFTNQKNLLSNYSTSSLQVRRDDGTAIVDVAANVVTVSAANTVQLTAPSVHANANAGTPKALMNDTFYQWYVTNIQPFLVGLGYLGPTVPVGCETTVLKGQ